ncbi:MAG: tail fiber domain-containing protein [Bacteroidia bacterium]
MKKGITVTMALVLSVHLGYSQLQVINNGYVGIGTNSPTQPLQVEGQALINNGNFFVQNGGNQIRMVPSSGGDAEMGSNTGRLTFWHTQGHYNSLHAFAFVPTSDLKLKQNINPLSNIIPVIKQLQGVSFQWKNLDSLGNPIQGTSGDSSYGFIAQDVQKILPNIVSADGHGYLGINYSALVPFLVEGVKQQQQSIDSLRGAVFPLPPSTPVLISPSNGASGDFSKSMFTWHSSVSNGLKSLVFYYIQVAKDTAFSNIVFSQSGITDTTTGVGIGCDSIADTYYWRVIAKNNIGASAWSTVFSFTDTTICRVIPIPIPPIKKIAAVGFASTSDSLFKTNVTPLTNSLSKVTQLKGVNYDWLHNNPKYLFDSTQQIGFIAQDVKKIVPQVVSKDVNGFLAVDYGRLTPILVEAIKTLKAEVDSMKAVMASCCTNSVTSRHAATAINTQDVELSDANIVVLNQNQPNPFAEQTTITYNSKIDQVLVDDFFT